MAEEKYFENDIGRALTADQMAEYREAHEAQERGVDIPRLRIAANVGSVVLFLLAGLLLIWGLASR